MKKIGIITGASSGMGKEFALQIAKKYDYDQLWLVARRKDKLEELTNQINNEKGTELAKPIVLDLSGKKGVDFFKNLLEEEDRFLRRIDSSLCIALLINNAGFGTYGPFDDTDTEREMDMVDLNCTSLTGMCGIALPYLKKDSVVINTASLAAFMPLGNFAVYGATKAFVLSFSVALAAELKSKGIKVCALCPGSVSTEFANIASEGVRKEVKGGHDPVKVVSHCLKKAFSGKTIAIWYPKWKFTAFLSRIVSRNLVAKYTFKYNKRPHISVNNKKNDEIDIPNFN